jgi:hypothetical protein
VGSHHVAFRALHDHALQQRWVGLVADLKQTRKSKEYHSSYSSEWSASSTSFKCANVFMYVQWKLIRSIYDEIHKGCSDHARVPCTP